MQAFKNRTLKPDVPVCVYRNLNRRDGVWFSVRQRGHVICHVRSIVLSNVLFVVHESGRQRVLSSGRKNVHAWVKGTVEIRKPDGLKPARYNPRLFSTFVDAETQAPLQAATMAYIDDSGIFYR